MSTKDFCRVTIRAYLWTNNGSNNWRRRCIRARIFPHGSEKLHSLFVVHRGADCDVALDCFALLCKVPRHKSNLCSARHGTRLEFVQTLLHEISSKGTTQTSVDVCNGCVGAAIGHHSWKCAGVHTNSPWRFQILVNRNNYVAGVSASGFRVSCNEI